MKRALADLPLHNGKAPAALFDRMVRLAGAVVMAIVNAYGSEEMLRRLSDPWWFQAFGCLLGFDWHSSGLTTVTCGALKEAYRAYGAELGIVVAGGKGATSRKAPEEIARAADRLGISQGEGLVYASRMSAKVDSAAVQDGYSLYHHSFFFTPKGSWCVVQQGMNDARGRARRYHWIGEAVEDFVSEPHAAIGDLLLSPEECSSAASGSLLNMVAQEAGPNRAASVALVREAPALFLETVRASVEGPTLFAPARHALLPIDVDLARLGRIIAAAHRAAPKDFEALLGTPQVGPKAIRSLALTAELIYEAPVSHRDPAPSRRWADYAYAHGGKDGHPFPVDRRLYDQDVAVVTDAVRKAKLGRTEKLEALRRIARLGDTAPHSP
ncbi:hypothetical protein MAMC_02067 [Methylacidimicrobium cyclopophantes]|uniref:DUF763 domain-containing protein n=1 Tax=Methylacidimicrobium cyclopophantes TaxID=1041766 RepID=A0A5E6MR91_9BACT|nr:DUF763 domain-containing protein [Methylacidimicrobium cyclopophantes]VVM08357.1 hypothetical protein MAMC_02067 [Methylacidimicrobium cyclopophantes]